MKSPRVVSLFLGILLAGAAGAAMQESVAGDRHPARIESEPALNPGDGVAIAAAERGAAGSATADAVAADPASPATARGSHDDAAASRRRTLLAQGSPERAATSPLQPAGSSNQPLRVRSLLGVAEPQAGATAGEARRDTPPYELESYALMVLGLCAIGLMVRRRTV